VGVMGVVVTFFLVLIPIYFILGPMYDISLVSALFIAAIISNTAIEVSAALLMESKFVKLKTVIIGASFVDDILAVFLIGLISPFAAEGIQTPHLESILYLAVLIIIFLVVSLTIATKIFDAIFERLKGHEGKITLTATLVTGFGFAIIAKLVGLHEVIGAYIAGLIIGKWGSQVTPLLRRRIAWEKLKYDIDTPLRAIFGPLFGCGLGAKLSKFNKKESVMIGYAMCGRGALELVLLNFALNINLIDETIFTALVFVTISTVILTPILYKLAGKE
jgi:Kef-type K+ transport system membrane component KefB